MLRRTEVVGREGKLETTVSMPSAWELSRVRVGTSGKKIQALKSQAPKGCTTVPGLHAFWVREGEESEQGIGAGEDQGNRWEARGEICGQVGGPTAGLSWNWDGERRLPTCEWKLRGCVLWTEMADHSFSRASGIKESQVSFELRNSESRVTWGITEGVSGVRRLEWGRNHKAGHLDKNEVQKEDRNPCKCLPSQEATLMLVDGQPENYLWQVFKSQAAFAPAPGVQPSIDVWQGNMNWF